MTASALPFPGPDADIQHDALRVFVRGLEIEAGIGVYDHEQGRRQKLVIDVTLDLAPHPVERLGDTINYEAVATAARLIAEGGHIGLVETFAERLALACLEDSQARRVTVRVEKPGALGGTAAPGCEITLSRR